jgi:hypothetical protein
MRTLQGHLPYQQEPGVSAQRTMRALVGALGILVLASVAGDGPAGPSPLYIDACALLPPSEISRVLGRPVEAGTRQDYGLTSEGSFSSVCVWKVRPEEPQAFDPTAPLGGRSFVILNAIRWPAGSDRARTFLEAFRKAAENGEIPAQPVPRPFGDEALWWGDGLAVRQGDVSLGISVFVPDLAPKSTGVLEERLAPAILRRLDPYQAAPHGGGEL